MDEVLLPLVRYVKALDLPATAGIPGYGWMIYANGNELRRVAMDNIVSEIIRANFEIITQTTVVPSSGYRRYRVVEAGSYTMPDGDIIVTESQLRNNFVYIVVDEGVSVLELIPIGVESIIKDWDTLEFGLEYPEVRYYNGSIYRVIEGQTTDANDPPGISAKWEVIVQDTTSFLQRIIDNSDNIGNLSQLNTLDTSSLVAAINEVLTSISQGDTKLQDLIDVNIINPKKGDVLYFDGSDWVNSQGYFRIVKKEGNTEDYIQTYDFCEGWISPNLFVKGLWKGDDDPSQIDLQNKDNWSNFLEIE